MYTFIKCLLLEFKWSLTSNEVHLRIMEHPCTKYEIHTNLYSWAMVFTSHSIAPAGLKWCLIVTTLASPIKFTRAISHVPIFTLLTMWFLVNCSGKFIHLSLPDPWLGVTHSTMHQVATQVSSHTYCDEHNNKGYPGYFNYISLKPIFTLCLPFPPPDLS